MLNKVSQKKINIGWHHFYIFDRITVLKVLSKSLLTQNIERKGKLWKEEEKIPMGRNRRQEPRGFGHISGAYGMIDKYINVVVNNIEIMKFKL